jgi:hypothetical protein
MNTSSHRFTELFAQLGLASDAPSIAFFLTTHAPLAAAVPLAEAQFWSTAQATFLQEQLQADADWAEVVDQLNAALRAPRS